MPRFFTGDELGNIKSLRYTEDKLELNMIYDGSSADKLKSIQALSTTFISNGSRLVRNIYSPPCQRVQDF